MRPQFVKWTLSLLVFATLTSWARPGFAETTQQDTSKAQDLLQKPTEIAGELTPGSDVTVELVKPENPFVGLVQTLSEKMELEGEFSTPKPNSWWKERWEETKNRFNFWNRYRVAARQYNTSSEKEKVASVPLKVVIANTGIATGGIHVLESTVLGPTLISIGNSIGGAVGKTLTGYGGLLVFPVPTGTPIDLLTETGCLIVGALIVQPSVQRGLYKVEKMALKIASPLIRKMGVDRFYQSLFRTQTGVEKLARAIEAHPPTIRWDAGDLDGLHPHAVSLKDGQPVVDFWTEKQPNGDVSLSRFVLYPAAQTAEGRKAIKQLDLGWNFRDAFLAPNMLTRAEHGTEEVKSDRFGLYSTNSTPVLLTSSTVFRSKPSRTPKIVQGTPDGTSPTTVTLPDGRALVDYWQEQQSDGSSKMLRFTLYDAAHSPEGRKSLGKLPVSVEMRDAFLSPGKQINERKAVRSFIGTAATYDCSAGFANLESARREIAQE